MTHPPLGYHSVTDVDRLIRQVNDLQSTLTWVYATTNRALMVSPQRPRDARDARDRAISEINKKLGAMLR